MKITKTILAFTMIFLGIAIFHAAKADADIGTEEQQFVDILNEKRKSLGKSELKISKAINEGASFLAEEYANDPELMNQGDGGHVDSQGRNPSKRGDAFDYYFLTENIGYGYETGQQIYDAWYASSGHKTNMLVSESRTLGIARAYKQGQTYNGGLVEWYWVAIFSDEGVERLIGNNLKESEMYSSSYKKISFTVKKWDKKKKKYKKAKWAEVKVYDRSNGRLIDHDIGDKNGNCSVYILGDGKKVTLKVSKFPGKKNSTYSLGSKKTRSKGKTINWIKNLKYAVKIR